MPLICCRLAEHSLLAVTSGTGARLFQRSPPIARCSAHLRVPPSECTVSTFATVDFRWRNKNPVWRGVHTWSPPKGESNYRYLKRPSLAEELLGRVSSPRRLFRQMRPLALPGTPTVFPVLNQTNWQLTGPPQASVSPYFRPREHALQPAGRTLVLDARRLAAIKAVAA